MILQKDFCRRLQAVRARRFEERTALLIYRTEIAYAFPSGSTAIRRPVNA
jgi:hypothetical protein